MRPRRALSSVLLLAALALVAACGGSGGGGGSDDPNPAEAIPGDVPVYLEAAVRPEGEQADAIETLAAKFGVQDPGQRITDFLESRDDGPGEISYAEDVEPWLGKRVGFAPLAVADETPFVAAAGVTEVDAASAFVEQVAERDGDELDEYEGTTFSRSDDGTVAGVAGDFLLLSDDERAFRRMVDLVDDGEGALAGNEAYETAVDGLPAERVGTFYAPPAQLIRGLQESGELPPGPQTQAVQALYGDVETVAAALVPYADRAVAELRVTLAEDAEDGLLPFGAPGLVREAPADAVGVLGLQELGPYVQRTLNAAVGALGGTALQGQLRSQLGIDLERDVFSWLGDTVVVVRGTTVEDVNAAVMIDALDEQAAATALPRLVGLAQSQGGLPFTETEIAGSDQAWRTPSLGPELGGNALFVARRGDRVAVGLGEEATQLGLEPGASLDANGGYDRALQAVDGLDPSFILDFQKALALVEQAAGDDPGFQRVRPFLEPLGLVVAGTERDGDALVSRFAVTVP